MQVNFDPNEIPADEYFPIPDGTYEVLLMETEMKYGNAGQEQLKLTLRVIDGPLTNRLIPLMLNWSYQLQNYDDRKGSDGKSEQSKKQTAMNISRRAFGKIAAACGKSGAIRDTSELQNIPFMVEIAGKEWGEYYNYSLKKALPLKGSTYQQPRNDHAAQAPARATASNGAAFPPPQRATIPAQGGGSYGDDDIPF